MNNPATMTNPAKQSLPPGPTESKPSGLTQFESDLDQILAQADGAYQQNANYNVYIKAIARVLVLLARLLARRLP